MMQKGSWPKWIGLLLIGILAVGASVAAHNGAWLDQVTFTEEPSTGAAILKLEAGDIDLYAFSIGDRALFGQVQASANLDYVMSYGSFNDLTFNPAGPVFNDGRLNPFAVPAFREAVHWLIDREYIANEIMGGMAVPKYSYLNSAFADAVRYREVMDEIADYYANDPDKAEAAMTTVMTDLGATLVGGKWQYNGQNVEIIAVIRTEDERRLIGDYVCGLLEEVGFTTQRLYRISREASPIWISSDPTDGQWHFYTGGWVTTAISRDQGTGFNQFHTNRILPWPLFQYLTEEMADAVSPGLWVTLDKLYNRDYATMDERADLFEEALWGCNQFANMIWLVDRTGFTPFRKGVQAAADLAGGVYGSQSWAQAIYFEGADGNPQVGGSLDMATSTLLVEPWNPVAGSNWTYDMLPIRGTGETGYVMDVNTGLIWPLHFDRAEITIQTGLPVGVSDGASWCTLKFQDVIQVPSDAWADWDAAAQKFITVAEKYPDGVTAKRKSVVYYPSSLYDTPLHDGSKISIADFVLGIIMSFDQAKPESKIYDEAQVGAFESFMSAFRGVKIVSRDPLIIETYSDLVTLDAENGVSDWFPYYSQGPGFWHTVTLGILAEEKKLLAFSSDKAQALGVEWANYIAGPSLEILHDQLLDCLSTGYRPYEPTMADYLSLSEAVNRWTLLDNWYADMGHFWVASGKFYLEQAFPTEKVIVLKRFADYPYPADQWQRLIDERP
ncbi:MAG: ABC transporter substrate-binding protein [Candidatus Bipolaricaulota bacterium]